MSDFLINPFSVTPAYPPFSINSTLTLNSGEVFIEGLTTNNTDLYISVSNAAQFAGGNQKIIKIDPNTMTRTATSSILYTSGGSFTLGDGLKWVSFEGNTRLVLLNNLRKAYFHNESTFALETPYSNIIGGQYAAAVSRPTNPNHPLFYDFGFSNANWIHSTKILTGSPVHGALANTAVFDTVVLREYDNVAFSARYSTPVQIMWCNFDSYSSPYLGTSTYLNTGEDYALCADIIGDTIYIGCGSGQVVRVGATSKARLSASSNFLEVNALVTVNNVVFCFTYNGTTSRVRKLHKDTLAEIESITLGSGPIMNAIKIDKYLYATERVNPGKVYKIGIGNTE